MNRKELLLSDLFSTLRHLCQDFAHEAIGSTTSENRKQKIDEETKRL